MQDILQKGRKDRKKAVFLITDGFSNGGDPRMAAKLLKESGATVFTFGIRTGNVEELYDIASEPGYIHSYLLDSFPEFEALARRALHRGDKKIFSLGVRLVSVPSANTNPVSNFWFISSLVAEGSEKINLCSSNYKKLSLAKVSD